jgi:hypothetical protein
MTGDGGKTRRRFRMMFHFVCRQRTLPLERNPAKCRRFAVRLRDNRNWPARIEAAPRRSSGGSHGPASYQRIRGPRALVTRQLRNCRAGRGVLPGAGTPPPDGLGFEVRRQRGWPPE